MIALGAFEAARAESGQSQPEPGDEQLGAGRFRDGGDRW